MASFEAKFKQAQAHAKGYTQGVFGAETEGAEPGELQEFLKMPEEEQMGLMYEVQSLVAEWRDLVKTRNEFQKESKTQNAQPVFLTKRIGGHFIRVPAPEIGSAPTAAKEATLKVSDDRIAKVKNQLSKLGAENPGLAEAYGNKVSELYIQVVMARQMEKLRARQEEINLTIADIRAAGKKSSAGTAVGTDLDAIASLEKEFADISLGLVEMEKHESFGPVIKRFIEIRGYADAAGKGRMIEIPSVAKLVGESLEFMRAHQPFLLAGHLGSGKTEDARHIAKLFMLENGIGYDVESGVDPDEVYESLQPEFFSGSDEASVYDLVGKLKLTAHDVGGADKVVARAKELEISLEKNGVKNVPKSALVSLILGQGSVTETMFAYGPLGRALRDGKPIIIDEINQMRPEVLARIYDILLRPVGSKVRLQENGDELFEVKPGFAVIGTLNLGHQYAGIKEFNAAFGSRWVGREVDYPPIEETYDLILAAMVRKDRTRLPPDFPPAAYDLLCDLAVVTREIQELFSGQTEGQRFMAKTNSVSAEKSQLEKTVVSTRDLMRKIVEPWKDSGFKKPLDMIIARNILAPAAISSKDDQKFLTELFLRRGFFRGWTAEKFASEGVRSVSDQEIKTLQSQIDTGEFAKTDQRFGGLLKGARGRADTLKSGLLIGTDFYRREEE